MDLVIDRWDEAGARVTMPGCFFGMSESPPLVGSAAPLTSSELSTVTWQPRVEPTKISVESDEPLELPLRGIQVVNLGTIIAGPYVATLLGELGADVIKVERPPNGDEFRTAHGGRGGVGFAVYNRGQRSLMLDLTDSAARSSFLELMQGTDVVVENYRPGVADRLGIAHDDLARINPLVSTVSISAFGGAGPLGMRPGFDPVVQAMSGIMRSQGGPDERDSPVFLTVPINDVVAAGLGAFGACAALFAREGVGRGQHIEVTLCGAATSVLSSELVRRAGRRLPRQGGRDFPGPHPLSRLYPVSDGWVRIDLGMPSWRRIFDAGLVAIPGVHVDMIFEQGPFEALMHAIAPMTVEEVLGHCQAAHVPAVKARQPHQLACDQELINERLLM